MIIGIDLGTSMVKAASFDREGDIRAVASRRSSPRSYRNGRIEQDFEGIVTAVSDVVREVCAGRTAEPDAIGITGQGDGLWPLDAPGHGVGWAGGVVAGRPGQPVSAEPD